MESILPGQGPTTLNNGIDAAALEVDRRIQDDRQYPEIAQMLGISADVLPGVSGMSDIDYPLLGTGQVSLPRLLEIGPVRRVPLPPELVEQFGHMQCNCMLGIFPDISRAWLTIDTDIYIWNYNDGGDLTYFDGLSETILSVGLVKPKPGVFQAHITHLLVLTTPVDIVILGVTFSALHTGASAPGSCVTEALSLLPEPLFCLPTDNTFFQVVEGTGTGRLFLAGQDGCLYEVAYQAEAGWFGQCCRKINHSRSSLSLFIPAVLQFSFSEEDPLMQIAVDHSRHILYTRSEKGTIQVFDLGSDGQSTSRVASLSHGTIASAAVNIARTVEKLNFSPVVHIAPIESSESAVCHLLAVTHTGVRLYFGTCSLRYPGTRPNTLILLHVRMPPGFSAAVTAPQRPARVHKALYSRGTLLLAAAASEDSDTLWCVAQHSFSLHFPLMEAQVSVSTDVRAWALACIEDCLPAQPMQSFTYGSLPPPMDPPAAVWQHMVPPRRFMLLSAQGSIMFEVLRPLEQLRHLLVTGGGADTEDVQKFFLLHREDQACATSLALACSRAAHDTEVSSWAARAFFRYGGESHINMKGTGPLAVSSSPGLPLTASTPIPVISTDAAAAFDGNMSVPIFNFSGKHGGVCLYIARILRTLWSQNIAFERLNTDAGRQFTLVESSTSTELLQAVLNRLESLHNFLERSAQFSGSSIANPSYPPPQRHLPGSFRHNVPSQQLQQELQRKYQAEAQSREQTSMHGLRKLVHITSQVLGLWTLLTEHQFPALVDGLSPELRESVKTMTLRELVVRGGEVTGGLIASLINRYIGDNASTDAISQRLRTICPLLYSPDDMLCSKANELLQAARQENARGERERLLQESLQLYSNIAHQIDLPLVCSQYRQVRFYEGVVELSLAAARRLDPQGLALHHYRQEQSSMDTHGQQALAARLECYRGVTMTLQELMNQAAAGPQSPGVPKQPGPPAASSDPNLLTNEEAAKHFEQLLVLCQQTGDELFHISLYEWIISSGHTDTLLRLSSPFLEPFLERMSQKARDPLPYIDLLWRFHEKSNNFGSAACVLARLADMCSTELSLQQRVEYLARAILSAKSSPGVPSLAPNGEFLHELEEKMEVARVQLQIQQTLSGTCSQIPGVPEALAQLNDNLLNVTKLYGDFAEPFGLSESKLAILHCAGYCDTTLIRSLWQEIIDKELQSSLGMSATDRMQLLHQKMVSLGKLYARSPRYLPIDEVAGHLERRVCSLSWDEGFVPHCLLDAGLSLLCLLDVYNGLFRCRDSSWQRLSKPLHLLHSVHVLLQTFVQEPERIAAQERRLFINRCLDIVASYLIELQAMDPCRDSTDLLQNFRSLQPKLERLLV
uniref:nuclear pore complex protein Nup155-like isoform X2 n=1 Tax=Myxine glutinosa TaxID=7769 RepID=UPI00358E3E7A